MDNLYDNMLPHDRSTKISKKKADQLGNPSTPLNELLRTMGNNNLLWFCGPVYIRYILLYYGLCVSSWWSNTVCCSENATAVCRWTACSRHKAQSCHVSIPQPSRGTLTRPDSIQLGIPLEAIEFWNGFRNAAQPFQNALAYATQHSA